MRSCLAPMDGITDLAYRTICKEIFVQYGHPDDQLMLRTEFMSADGYCINPQGVIKHLRKTEFEPELIAQIFGGDGETLLQCALDIENSYDFAGIEINMGCPSPSVMKCDAGSAMLKDKPKTLAILRTISQSLHLPLSLKTRVGLTEEDKQEQFQFLLDASPYVRMIGIHGRTYKQSHSGDVDREFIWKLKQALPDKVIIGNGGIRSYTHAQQHLTSQDATTTLDGIMIAQSAIGNPRILTPHQPNITDRFTTIFRHLRLMMASEYLFDLALQEGRLPLTMPTYAQLQDIAQRIASYTDRTYRTPREFRKYLFNYISGLPDNKTIKKSIPSRTTFAQLEKGLQDYQAQLERLSETPGAVI